MLIIKKSVPQNITSEKSNTDNILYISGYASTFGAPSDEYGDVIAKGAFKDSIDKWNSVSYKLPMLWNHTLNECIGYWYKFEEDDIGLKVEGKIFKNTERGLYVATCVENESISAVSIGFKLLKSIKAKEYRIIENLKLLEISIVTVPAKENARIQIQKHTN